jgi:hypothetical protein
MEEKRRIVIVLPTQMRSVTWTKAKVRKSKVACVTICSTGKKGKG